jgi:hypothetical protein
MAQSRAEEIAMTMTNAQLLAYDRPLPELEKQRRYILRIAVTPIGCGRCGGMHSQVEASGKPLDDYDSRNMKDDAYACPDTGDSIRYIVPFVGSPHFVFNRAHLGSRT